MTIDFNTRRRAAILGAFVLGAGILGTVGCLVRETSLLAGEVQQLNQTLEHKTAQPQPHRHVFWHKGHHHTNAHAKVDCTPTILTLTLD